jgi:YHS domain-containing protein
MLKLKTICRLAALAATMFAPVGLNAQTGINWRNNFDAAKIEAAQTNRLLLVHFWKTSCYPCRVLEQTVFNQPSVAAAVEQDYVPVKVDTDSAPALANMFHIDVVPTDVVVTPRGEVIAKLNCPSAAEAYQRQLQTLARHVRQTSMAKGGGVAQPGEPNVNAAYANLPTSRAPQQAPGTNFAPPAAPALSGTTPLSPYGAGGTAPRQPSSPQSNPYFSQGAPPSQPGRYGQAANPPVGAAATNIAQSTAASPGSAMPRSYQAAAAAAAPVAAPANVAQVTTPPAVAAAARPPAASSSATPAGQSPAAAASVGATTAVAAAGSKPVQPEVAPTQSAASPAETTTAATEQKIAAAPLPQLPPNCPPVAFDGYCPVTLKKLNKWTLGSSAFGAIHRGRTYLFVGTAERDQFLADPDAYAPVFAGYDPVLLLEKHQTVAGRREFGYSFDGRFYLFSSKETRDKFGSSVEVARSYAAGVRQAMNRIDGSPAATVRR